MGKRPENVKFTRVPNGENKICDEMNYANDNFDSWEPKTFAEKRLKEAIVNIENNIENNIVNKKNKKKL
jgi:hypothetical protein